MLNKNVCTFSVPCERLPTLGNENSLFLTEMLFETPWGHGRPRLWVMNVRTEMLVLPGFRGLDRSFCPWKSAGISGRTYAGHPAPQLTLWAAFSFLNLWFAKPMVCNRVASMKGWDHERTKKRQRQVRQPQARGLSAGLCCRISGNSGNHGNNEIVETTEMTTTARIWGANNGFPKQRA